MSEEIKKDETTEEMNQNNQEPATEPKQETPAAEDEKPEKVGFIQKCKNFGKEKVFPAAKLVGKGVAKGASIAGGALATAYLIGMAIGGYTAVKGSKAEESTDQATDQEQETASEAPAETKTEDVQVVLNENNVQTETNIE